MSLVDPFAMPGMSDPLLTAENSFLWGPIDAHRFDSGVLDSTTVDAANTPTTTLRPGLVLGRITASGKLKHYSPAATDGSQVPVGILAVELNMLDPNTGVAADHQGRFCYFGNADPAKLYGFDEYARQLLSGRFVWADYRLNDLGWQIATKTTNYTVVAADNNTEFFTTGAAGAVNFTLPATPVKGYRFRFFNTVDQNMVITAPAGKLVGLNNAAATTLTFSTASQKIGAAAEITVDDTGTKYVAHLLSTNAPAYA